MEIFENSEAHYATFIKLNEEWIAKHFKIEAVDKELAAKPKSIVENGGFVFSLFHDGEVLGVCALFNKGEGRYELARMAVAQAQRGRGFGDALMQMSLTKLEELGAKTVYLLSNTKLKAALSLYQKYGFKTVSTGTHPVYERCNIVMERIL